MLKDQTKHELGKSTSTFIKTVIVLTKDLHSFTMTVSLSNDLVVYCKYVH